MVVHTNQEPNTQAPHLSGGVFKLSGLQAPASRVDKGATKSPQRGFT